MRLTILFAVVATAITAAAQTPNTTIIYTSSDKNVVTPYNTEYIQDASGNTLTVESNTYEGDEGKMVFSGYIARIGSDAFYNRPKLTSVTLPESVTYIGANAFNSCGLTSIEIPNNVTEIGSKAFEDCRSLNLVVLGSKVTKLGSAAFYMCSNLKEVKSLNTSAPTIYENTLNEDTFQGVNASCVYKVPGSAMVSYRDAWSDYIDKIQAISLDLTDAAGYTYDFDFVSGTANYTRDFPNADWQALCLPFAMNYDDWSSLGTMAEMTGVSGDVLLWTIITSGSTEPGKPYIFKPNSAGEATLTVSSAAVKSCDTTSKVSYSDYTLTGTYATKTNMFTSKAYALYNGNFYYATKDDQTLKPYRLFLNVPESVYAKKAPVRCRIDGEDVSGIEGIEFELQPEEGDAYNLLGMPVDDSYRGIVIINGKKVIRK